MRRLLEALLLPTCSSLLLLAAGALVWRRRPRAGRALCAAGAVWLWLAATPFVAGALLRTLQPEPLPAEGPLPAAQAIVVLAAEADREGAEYGGPVAGAMTLQRLRYGAALHRRTKLPVLVSGGRPGTGLPSLADLMARCLEEEFSVPVRWREGASGDTWENAERSAALLRADGVARVLLVSSAFHLPRAAACFRAHGIDVVPAPTALRGPPFDGALSFVPSWQALRDTSYALHEWVGRAAYAFR